MTRASMEAGPAIGIVDYGMGNRRSVEKAFERVGAAVRLTSDHDALRAADGIVVPGVGAYPEAMRRLRAEGLDELILERAEQVPVIGLCLGMQLLYEGSDEFGATEGLGLLRGRVRALHAPGLKLPHIGWHSVRFERDTPLTPPSREAAYYHVHSFAAERSPDAIGFGEYGGEFVSIAARGNVFGCQFHPEKSSHAGLALLRSFTQLCAKVPA
ncbi:MAG TPA: imidazole glycerol phosphate synthase subunit HisH [Solirubrobacteraceae bacterium]|nr:imidazole glycerol phosphate synthase subunit HisH [Solirubrobacteraceae bacterium]